MSARNPDAHGSTALHWGAQLVPKRTPVGSFPDDPARDLVVGPGVALNQEHLVRAVGHFRPDRIATGAQAPLRVRLMADRSNTGTSEGRNDVSSRASGTSRFAEAPG